MDLVGRKLLLDRGEMAGELLLDMQQTAQEIAGSGEGMKTLAEALDKALAACQEAVEHLFANAVENWAVAGAGGFNLMMLMGTTVAGTLLAKSAAVSARQLAAGEGNDDFNRTKVITATFYVQHILPRTAVYLQAIKADADVVMALDEDAF